jgi:hypothetical protein
MANADNLNRPAQETQPLLHPGNNIGRPVWFDRPLCVYSAARTVALWPSNVNVLLVFVPLGLAAAVFNWSSILTSIFNFLAIIPLSAAVSDSSDKLSSEFGDLLGAVQDGVGNSIYPEAAINSRLKYTSPCCLLPRTRPQDACQLTMIPMPSILPYFRPHEHVSGTKTPRYPGVSPPGSPALPADESTALLGEAASHPQLWVKIPRYVYNAIKATLCCSKANLLLGFVPLSPIAGARNWKPVVVFILNFIAILPLAELLSWSTEQLSGSVGKTLGGLLNATFGNAIEIVSCAYTTPLNILC